MPRTSQRARTGRLGFFSHDQLRRRPHPSPPGGPARDRATLGESTVGIIAVHEIAGGTISTLWIFPAEQPKQRLDLGAPRWRGEPPHLEARASR